MTAPTVPDRWISPILLALKDCLCDTLGTSPYTPVCFCCVVHSQTLPPMDRCDCECVEGDPPVEGNGQGWVRLVRVYDRQEQASSRVCTNFLVAEVQLGVYRCIDGVIDDSTNPPILPTCEQLENDADLMLADRAAMWRAVQCCDALKGLRVSGMSWQPVGPSGGCAGGVLNLAVEFVMP